MAKQERLYTHEGYEVEQYMEFLRQKYNNNMIYMFVVINNVSSVDLEILAACIRLQLKKVNDASTKSNKLISID